MAESQRKAKSLKFPLLMSERMKSDSVANERKKNQWRNWSVQSLRISNFRSIVNADIQISPLTIIVGGNSSGKSSLLGILRLVSQAQKDPADSGFLPLNGRYSEFGTFDDLMFQNKVGALGLNGSIKLSLILGLRDSLGNRLSLFDSAKIKIDLTLIGPNEGPSAPVAEIYKFSADFQIPKNDFRVQFQCESLDQSIPGISMVVVNQENVRNRRLSIDSNLDSIRSVSGSISVQIQGETENIELSGIIFNGLQPTALFRRQSKADVLSHRIVELSKKTSINLGAFQFENDHQKARNEEKLKQALTSSSIELSEEEKNSYTSVLAQKFANLTDAEIDGLLSGDIYLPEVLVGDVINKVDEYTKNFLYETLRTHFAKNYFVDSLQKIDIRYAEDVLAEVPSPLDSVFEGISDLFSNHFFSVGPLRQGPQYVHQYRWHSDRERTSGEDILTSVNSRRKLEMKIRGFDKEGKIKLKSLAFWLTYWAKELGIAEEIEISEIAGIGIQIMVRPFGLNRSIAWNMVGVGVSQVLPVIANVLSAKPGEIIVIEQPELHLHPDAQALLGDFLLVASATGRRLIVETHSDLLITRLRRRCMEKNFDETEIDAAAVTFIFAERSSKTGETILRNVRLDGQGGFVDWPLGFADQTTKEALALIKAMSEKIA